ncbi:MAG: dihydrodipicolinate synthase family protein [Planctomycetota bacterium]|jgi:dihydrodipicolinate synthase/N-acetylneuraminate lyase|nr:dihydrodipicolinate synthase family protein [Planctomycetota bacterium]
MAFKGSLVPNITIFRQDGSVDFEKTRWHMSWMLGHGTDGLFLTGSYGLGPLLSHDERVSIFALAKEAAAGFKDKILIPHVGCIDAKQAVDLAVAAEKVGVDAVGAVPPFYYKHTDESVFNYYKAIIGAVNIPVFAYNNPATSRYTISFNMVKRLQAIGLAGLKDSPMQVGFLSEVAYDAKLNRKNFQIIGGTSTGWLPYYFMGIEAMIAGTNNWAPEMVTELVRATFAGEWPRAEEVYLEMADINRKMHFCDSTIASHMALYARKFDAGYPRAPMLLPGFDDPKYAEIRGWLKASFDRLGIPLTEGDCVTASA